jgi:hypothetical protein
VEIKTGTSVYIIQSNSGYKGPGIVVGLAYAGSYLVKVENHSRPIIVVQRQHLNILDLPLEKEESPQEAPSEDIRSSKKRKKQKEIEEFLSESVEGRFDDENPTDGRRGKGRDRKGRRLPSRRRR